MNVTHCSTSRLDSEVPDDIFSMSGPLPILEPGEGADYFIESEDAHHHYMGHRSHEAPLKTVTYQANSRSGELAGFISFRVLREDDTASTRIFVSVEYLYVMQRFRRQGLSTLLLCQLIQEVQAVLHDATGDGRRPKVYIHAGTQPQSAAEGRILRALEERLLALAKRCVGVDLIGHHLEHPLGAKRRLQERFQRTWQAV